MCGRFALSIIPGGIQDLYDLEVPPPEEAKPRYNIAPTQPVLIIPNSPPRRAGFARWGLVPAGSRDLAAGARMINARAETLVERGAFREAIRRRRCLVPADAFFEWRKEADGSKTPVLIQLASGEPFAFAGLWSTWVSPQGEKIPSFTIITCEPNDLVRPIHDRMPVILPKASWAQWLQPGDVDTALTLPLLKPFDAALMRAFPVSRAVNAAANDVPECIAPAPVDPGAPPGST
jgi:putative SOS response-associated peptidase YedK